MSQRSPRRLRDVAEEGGRLDSVVAPRRLRDVAEEEARLDSAEASERSGIPLICRSCFHGSPYVRMKPTGRDGDCILCHCSFKVFTFSRKQSGPRRRRARLDKTEICRSCSKGRELCQVCLLSFP